MGTNYEVGVQTGDPRRQPVHLGKQSAGWPFLFRGQPEWSPEHRFAEWVKLATSGPIFDEYGQFMTFDRLMLKIVISYVEYGGVAHQDAATNHGFQFIDSEFC